MKKYTAIFSPKKKTVQSIRDEEGVEIRAGDVVLLRDDPEVEGQEFALIQSLKEGDQGLEAKCVLMKLFNDAEALTAKHVIPNTNKNRFSKGQELVMMNSIVDVLVEELFQKVQCVSFVSFDALSRDDKKAEHLYFCRYAFDSDSNKTSVELDWQDITQNMAGFIDVLYELITDKPRKRRAAVKASRQTVESDFEEEEVDEVDEEDEGDDEYDSPVEEAKKRARTPKAKKAATPKKAAPTKKAATTPRKKRGLDEMDLPQPESNVAPMTTPKKKRKTENGHGLATPKRMFYKQALSDATLPYKTADLSPSKLSPHQAARAKLHVAAVPDTLPCRETEFSNVYLGIESAIRSGSGTCIFVSGTPGSGKTATVREVVSQLQLRVEDNEIPDFLFVELNGMKLTNPHTTYELLWEQLSGERLAYNNAIKLLEHRFQQKSNETPLVVVLDELDQLVTLNQSVMYNFFNWPTLPHSKLIVVAIANTMDLPERTLSNKISSRLGLTRIQFPGYTHEQLKMIIESRLGGIAESSGTVVRPDAIEFASRKIASVSGDARRALDLCRRAVEIAELGAEEVQIKHIQQAANEATSTPIYNYLQGLPLAFKIFLCALLARKRRNGLPSDSLGDIIEEIERMIKSSENAGFLSHILLEGGKRVRMTGFMNAVTELVEAGIIIQQSIKGERSAQVRLTIGVEEITSALKNDDDVKGML
ncbi:Origin recognition complex subunit 1 [Yarrowia sp. C11]|nr:Origin recognition complex subunit 1 [Yarrowia sp. E02]KAG5369425.1 Origin recognition complex subunit 1 [Yarrowia sp. C11]